jgi:hypothetical protein
MSQPLDSGSSADQGRGCLALATLLLLAPFTVQLFSWTAIYALVMEGDFTYYGHYLSAVWSGSAGELPSLIGLYSVVLTIAICAVAALVALLRFRTRK